MSELNRRLDVARAIGDPVADTAVSELGQRVWAINALVKSLNGHDDPLPPGVPSVVARLLVPELPEWADRHRVRAAQAFAERHLPLITVALFCAALPASYGEPEGAAVLAATGRMQGDLDRRVNETARFVFDVLRPNGFDRGGRGRLSTGRVRLMHSAVRRALRECDPNGNMPIDQEQMLGTLLLFSVLVLDSLERLGVKVSARDAEDYLHLWCVVGEMLGIERDLLPNGRAEAKRLLVKLQRRRFAPSEAGEALVRDLVLGMERHVGPLLSAAPRQLVRHLLGDELSDRLGVPAGGPLARRWLDRLVARTARASESPSPVAVLFGRTLLEGICSFKLKGARVTFPMPPLPLERVLASPPCDFP